jgi:membrane associated rhomboid family serine protease/uncharacterized Tic20 family protein/ssDNA-binding Zn-finger/Zn-ribbon topoisomerase 1
VSLADHFEQHEEQAFVAKALATAVAVSLVKFYLPGLVSFCYLILPVAFLIGLKLHAATSGVDAMELLRENITFFPVMRSEKERRAEVKPWVTYGIILVNCLVFYCFETSASDAVIDNLVFLPHHPDLFNVPISAFTALFLHASNGHLWGNMTFLWVVGSAVERRVGRLKFFWLYLGTGLIGGLVFISAEFLASGRAGHALGASGAIAGIMGIFAIRCYFKTMIFPLPILGIFSLVLPISLKVRLNSLLIMALFFLSDLSGGIQQITGESHSMIGHWAHLGGMISGMLIAGYLKLGDAAVEERHLEIGIKASQAAMGYEGGGRSLQIALDRNPDNLDALLGMARLKTKFSATPQGRELYERSLGMLLAERPAEVVEVYREYLGKYLVPPLDHALVTGLAAALRTGGETDLLIPCLERLVALPETTPGQREKAHYQLATLLEFTSCFEAARSSFARFVYHYPDSVLADNARARAGGEVYLAPPATPEIKAASAVSAEPAAAAAESCPTCGAVMAVRTSTSGPKQGVPFWVCSGYPGCRTFHPVAVPGEACQAAPPPLPQRYRLVFDGTIGFTSDPEETKENLARLLRCGRDQVERLCSGNPTVLKTGLDHATALKYKDAVSRTGALCTLEAEGAPAVAPPPRAAQPEAVVAAQAVPSGQAVTSALPKQSFFCPKCGHLQEKGESCPLCGVYFAKVAQIAERDFNSFQNHLVGGSAQPVMSERHERRWAMLCHLLALSGFLIPLGNILGPLLIWRWQRKHSAFIDHHGKVSVNYQITLLLFMVGLIVISVFTGFTAMFVGPLFGILGIYTIVMIAVGAIRSHRGDYLEIALSAEFLK